MHITEYHQPAVGAENLTGKKNPLGMMPKMKPGRRFYPHDAAGLVLFQPSDSLPAAAEGTVQINGDQPVPLVIVRIFYKKGYRPSGPFQNRRRL